jgi:tetratricopeptide (TPR) repeat protein
MRSFAVSLFLAVSLSGWGLAQQPSPPDQTPGQSQSPPRSDTDKDQNADVDARQSSSRDTRVDISPPKDDAKNHPQSGVAVSEPAAETSPEVQEFHPWNPYRAAKDDEVGEFYLKRKNYRAALARYQDALAWKDNDAVANFRMAECYEKLAQPEQAIPHYQEYLKILPEGPFSKDARKALQRLGAPPKPETSQTVPLKP